MSQKTLIEEDLKLIYPHGKITLQEIISALAKSFEVEEVGDRIFLSPESEEDDNLVDETQTNE